MCIIFRNKLSSLQLRATFLVYAYDGLKTRFQFVKKEMDFIFTGQAYNEENIWTAASDGDLPRVQVLIREGVDVNTQDDTGYSPM